MVRYGQLLSMRGADYISRFKPEKRGTCFISVTGARSIFGAWAHRNRRAGMKIAFNSPVWELYSTLHSPATRIVTDGVHSTESSAAHPITALPPGRRGRKEESVGKRERGGGGGMEMEKDEIWQEVWAPSCVLLFGEPFRNETEKSCFSSRNIFSPLLFHLDAIQYQEFLYVTVL